MLSLATKKIINQTYQKWIENIPSFPADEYTLRIVFYKDSGNRFTIQCEATDTGHQIILDPSKEGYKNKSHGQYQYQAIASKNGIDYPVEMRTITLLPNLEKDDDPRGYWTRIYEAYKSAYEKLAKRETKSVDVLGMTVTYAERSDLVARMREARRHMEIENGTKKSGTQIFKSVFR